MPSARLFKADIDRADDCIKTLFTALAALSLSKA
jgi:hypothetical protein